MVCAGMRIPAAQILLWQWQRQQFHSAPHSLLCPSKEGAAMSHTPLSGGLAAPGCVPALSPGSLFGVP